MNAKIYNATLMEIKVESKYGKNIEISHIELFKNQYGGVVLYFRLPEYKYINNIDCNVAGQECLIELFHQQAGSGVLHSQICLHGWPFALTNFDVIPDKHAYYVVGMDRNKYLLATND